MTHTISSQSNKLTLTEVLANLGANDKVYGVALFGSLPTDATNPVTDYDLLIMVKDPPVQIFQLQTYIGDIMADIAFVETDVADRVVALENPVLATSNEGFLIGWLEGAQTFYDKEGRFARIQHKLMTGNWRLAATEADTYADWFWLNFDLRQMKRIVTSHDPIYQLTMDIHLMTNLAQIWRAYCHYHNIHWRGVKATARYLMTHDPDYLSLYQSCMNESDRVRKLALLEQLVKLTFAPAADLWPTGSTAVYLKNPAEQPESVIEALEFWENLVKPKTDSH